MLHTKIADVLVDTCTGNPFKGNTDVGSVQVEKVFKAL